MKSGTVVGVQYLRGLAAILVVIEHAAMLAAAPRHFGRVPLALYGFGHFGVTMFFAISGFIITLVSLRPDLTPAISRRDFAVRRFVRIVPFLWACALAYAALRFAATRQADLLPTLRAMVIWPVGNLRPNVVWTLRFEVLFYAVFALALLGRRRQPWLLVAWILSPFALAIARPQTFAPQSPFEIDLLGLVAAPNNLNFASGVAIGVLYLKGKLPNRLPGGVTLIAAATILGWTLVSMSADRFWVAWLIAATLLALGVSLAGREGPIEKAGHLLGDASYAVYLVHPMVLNALVPLLAKPGHASHALGWHAVLTTIAVSVGVLAHLFVERPLTRFAKRIARGKQHPSPEATASAT